MKNLNLCGKFILILLFLSVISLVFIEKLLFAYGNFFIIETATKGADAIVILSGDDQNRIQRAIELKKAGYAEKLYVTTTKDYSNNYLEIYKTREERLKRIFTLEGESFSYIPSLKLGATSTFDEAYDLEKFAKKNRWKKIILVTDEFHTRRALYAFQKIIKNKLIIEISGASNNIYTANNWYKTEVGLGTFIPEGLKYILYHIIDSNIVE